MPDNHQNVDRPDKKKLIQKKEVYKQIANILVREELISLDEKLRFMSALRKDGTVTAEQKNSLK